MIFLIKTWENIYSLALRLWEAETLSNEKQNAYFFVVIL